MNLLAELLGNKNWINSLGAPRAPFAAAHKNFIRPYDVLNENNKEMKRRNVIGSDDYYHSRAAYENGRAGLVPGIVGQIYGLGKEAVDVVKKTASGNPLAETLADSGKDLKNNWNSFILGYRNPGVPHDKSEYLESLKVNGL